MSKKVFNQMVIAVNTSFSNRTTRRGNDSKFTVEDQILITLEYYREYRTMFHMSVSYGVHESTICRIITRIENILIADKLFQLPPKREISKMNIEVIIVDAMEIAIQIPKKNKSNIIQERKRNIL